MEICHSETESNDEGNLEKGCYERSENETLVCMMQLLNMIVLIKCCEAPQGVNPPKSSP